MENYNMKNLAKILPVFLLASMTLSSLQINSIDRVSARTGTALCIAGLAAACWAGYKTYTKHAYLSHVSHQFTNQVLFRAINERDVHGVASCIADGANVNTVSNDGETALMLAIKLNSKHSANLVAQLLAAGAEVDTKNANGDTALMLAITTGNLDIITQLLAAGADVNISNTKGETPLIAAAMYQNLDIITKLLAAGANVNAVSKTGVTALTVTFPLLNDSSNKELARNSQNIFEQLLAAGAIVPEWMRTSLATH